MMLTVIFVMAQLISTCVITCYFFSQMRSQKNSKRTFAGDSERELTKIRRLREIRLTEPLSEKSRPKSVSEIVGQQNAIKALRAAICCENPQHVIIYGPPGVGKTAAARVILEEAKLRTDCPFLDDAKFIEMDATVLRFDERNIADPLIGSVHDPIYQGAGAYGHAGVPQPKAGAVTKAHGGILFLDEIGELHPHQMNKLLKVLEDRKVFLESAYYRSEDENIPRHIHDIFTNGLPADFRLIGATTRRPEEIPEALRSRCVEIYFNPLSAEDITTIVKNAVRNGKCLMQEGTKELIAEYAQNGRDAVNILQTAIGIATYDGRNELSKEDLEWVIEQGKYSPRYEKKVDRKNRIGIVNGLAVSGSSGCVMEIDATAVYRGEGKGSFQITGIVDEEIIKGSAQQLKRRSTAYNSAEVVMTLLKQKLQLNPDDYDIHVHIPGGIPVDGPSAGTAMLMAVYSAITRHEIPGSVAFTGEISITGEVLMVGGVTPKLEAAVRAGIESVYIPKDNDRECYKKLKTNVVPIQNIDELFRLVFNQEIKAEILQQESIKVLTASGV